MMFEHTKVYMGKSVSLALFYILPSSWVYQIFRDPKSFHFNCLTMVHRALFCLMCEKFPKRTLKRDKKFN